MITIRYNPGAGVITLTVSRWRTGTSAEDWPEVLECARRHLFERDEAAEKASELRYLEIMQARKERDNPRPAEPKKVTVSRKKA